MPVSLAAIDSVRPLDVVNAPGGPSLDAGHSRDHAPISSHPPSPQRPGGPRATSLGKLGVSGSCRKGNPPQQYHISFNGKGLWRDRGKVKVLDHHRVEIKLGASYPRTMPEIRWITPIYHPNISEIGMVCLGGYGTHWVPSVQLDELCVMLWDMVRYHNYDIRSPYNRESALWVGRPDDVSVPDRRRPLRDLRAAQGAWLRRPKARRARTRLHAVPIGVIDPQVARSSSDNPVGRVLQFIERYGRVFGDSSPSDCDRHFRVRTSTSCARSSSEPASLHRDGARDAARAAVGCDETAGRSSRLTVRQRPPDAVADPVSPR